MNLEIFEAPSFLKSLKRLSKKYKKLASDLERLRNELGSHNNAVDLGNGFYKIRLKNSSIAKGKSGGFRVVYFFKTDVNEIYLLDIFIKSELENINKDKLAELATNYGLI